MTLQPDDAESLVTRALAMDPTSGWAWERRGFVRISCGAASDLAIADFRRALQLHGPFMPRDNCFNGIAIAHANAGRFEEAAHWYRRALAENPGATFLFKFLARSLWRLGDQPAARRSVEDLRRAHPKLTVSCLADAGMTPPEFLDILEHAGMPF